MPGETPIRFRAVFDESRIVPAMIGRFVERVLGGFPRPLVAYLADSGKLSGKDLKTLRAIAQKISQPETK